MELLKCRNLKKVFGKGDSQVTALNGIDLSVEKGEFTAIVGASGSGKSTLLHILGSVEKPTEGTVVVDGVDLGTLSVRDAAVFRRRKVGLVYQFYNLIPTLTVEKNIIMPMLLDKRRPDGEYLNRIMESLGISGKRNALPHQLSGGQQQRTAIARALIYRPAILLADDCEIIGLTRRNPIKSRVLAYVRSEPLISLGLRVSCMTLYTTFTQVLFRFLIMLH